MYFMVSTALLTLTVASVWAQTAPPKAAPAKGPVGYLSARDRPDVVKVVAPPPAPGDARAIRDRQVYRDTRSMKDTPRWALALSDNDLSITGIYKGFSCSLGANLTPTNAPRLTAMIGRATADLTTAYSTLKDLYGTKRPFQIEPAPVCLPSTAGLENSPDFVSGHATLGWAVGLIFAELAPDASTGVLMRGRAFAESRVVCGLHHVSAVEGGVATGTAVVAALHGSSAFRADMDRARKELAALRASSKEKPASCALESQALEKNPY